ncbi:hypothetical protein [Vibrio phage JSF28]|jgi:hypothetical protein|uniref:Uncharacterized protein n=8 Tax=Chatterjeevirus ICP3 TaxID=2733612 RepID=A0A2D0Z1S0_9CAUD|nr:hypothetical protein [Vibrio phage JSF25]ASV42886.1 hypothetical protein [Vibrio phage JSF28]ASV42987.1 hypothetical protein [Vibrio phage JSF31]ASV43012.1 hypothetical protein [Vibrio phage JSF32]ASV43094.1 hypothetical protein [Vibrio phage JSF35]ASV43155.1 hypothetical protein [Vibrio phage JSF36]ASV43214.1 hypothetical protein [Vibrio phage JSF18]QIW90088.1 hypothetical protein JSF37_00024 [Vibrio phage JSF37]
MRDIIHSLEAEVWYNHFDIIYRVRLFDNRTGEEYFFKYPVFSLKTSEDAMDKAYQDLASQWGTIL